MWLVNKMRTGIATMGIKLRLLNAQVIIRNLRNMQGNLKPLPPTGAKRRMGLEYQDRARLLGGTTHWRAQRPPEVVESRPGDGQRSSSGPILD